MNVYIKDTTGSLQLPTQANPGEDGGYDVIATSEPHVVGFGTQEPGDVKLWSHILYIEYGTGLFLAPESERVMVHGITNTHFEQELRFHIESFPRSSVSKYNLVLANSVGTIDTGYRNEIMCRFKYIFQPEDLRIVGGKIFGEVNPARIYSKGDKMVQLKPRQNVSINFKKVNELPASSRNLGGFGSSGN